MGGDPFYKPEMLDLPPHPMWDAVFGETAAEEPLKTVPPLFVRRQPSGHGKRRKDRKSERKARKSGRGG